MFKKITVKAIKWGILASLGLTLFYAIIMLLTMPSLQEIWEIFLPFWYLIIGIVIGFGVQIGLWIYLKQSSHHLGKTLPGVSGTASGTAMVACCVHHLAEILPIIGLSGAAIFFTQYQKAFLIIGLSINLLSIAYMLHLIDKKTA